MYVKWFQLTSMIQYFILQIWVCVRKVYANESICEAWVWLGECVLEVGVGMHYHVDVFFVVDMGLCVLMGYSPRIDTVSSVIIEEAPKPYLQYVIKYLIHYHI